MSDAAVESDIRPKPFRFKRPRPSNLHTDEDDLPSQNYTSRTRFESHHSRKRRRRHHHHHHHHSRRHSTREPSPIAHPADAFREALFDALADDEGADYWAHVYGQPMHTYPRAEVERVYGGAVGDDEYANYVRERMWERSHAHIIEERERKEKDKTERERREREKRKERRRWEEEDEWRKEFESRLRKRGYKVERSKWKEFWERYGRNWEAVLCARRKETREKGNEGEEEEKVDVRGEIPWPVESGRAKHVSKDAVELFFHNALSNLDPAMKSATLRSERVRWHPDKIQHHFGGQNIDDTTMKLVNTVFLVVDAMYNDTRSKE